MWKTENTDMFCALRNEQYSIAGHQHNINRCLQNVFTALSIQLSREKSRVEMVHIILTFDKCVVQRLILNTNTHKY